MTCMGLKAMVATLLNRGIPHSRRPPAMDRAQGWVRDNGCQTL
jgi:hypothetical protein